MATFGVLPAKQDASPVMKFHCTLFAAATLVFLITPGLTVEPDRPPAAAGQPPRKVAAIGDSITAGAGTLNRTTDSYPSQLAQMLGDQWEVKNFGVTGATLL